MCISSQSHAAAEMSTELLPLEGATSKVWEHVGFPAKDGKILEPDKKSVMWCTASSVEGV